MANRETYHHGNLRQAILDESRRQLESRGIASFSLNAVATAIGVSSGAPYHHFGGREELLGCLAEEVYGELLICVSEAGPTEDQADDPRERARSSIVMGCHALLQYCLDHPVLFALATRDHRPASTSTVFGLGRAMSEGSAPVTSTAGLIDAARAQEFGSAVYVMLRGVTAVAEEAPRLIKDSTEPHLLLDQMLDALFVAYAPAASAPGRQAPA